MNIFDELKQSVKNNIAEAVKQAGEDACENMRDKLTADGHTGTGQLLKNIKHEEGEDGSVIYTNIVIPDYGKYIDGGTGAAHGVEGGRVGSWRYQDRNGDWHTTDGMDADPFIDTSVQAAVTDLNTVINTQIKQALSKMSKG
jgi:hypothetical protein